MTRPAGLRPTYPLRTERLLLRPHRLDDVDDLLRFHSDPEVVRYVPWPVRDREAVLETLAVKVDQGELTAPGEWLVLAIELAETGRVVGEVLLKWDSAEDRRGELGFALARDQHGRGFAAEAAREALRLGFEDLGLRNVTAVCVEDNAASARLLGRLGFTLEGRLVDQTVFKGELVTELVFGLTDDAWHADGGPDDLAAIDAVVATFFAAFTSGDPTDVDERIAALRGVLLPEAVVVRTCGLEPTAYDVDSFIAPRRRMLVDGTLADFTEHASGGRIEVFGDIAAWFGRYTKAGRMDGDDYAGAGMKSIQLVRTALGWRISAAAWDDERPGLTASDHRSVLG